MIDQNVWDLAIKKVRRDLTPRLIVGLAALDRAEAIDLLSMKAKDRDAFGGLPYLTCMQAILVHSDVLSSYQTSEMRFKRMMAYIVLAGPDRWLEWFGHDNIFSVLWKCCPMWFVSAMSTELISLTERIRDSFMKREGFNSYYYSSYQDDEVVKMAEDAIRALQNPDFVPDQSDYMDPYPWHPSTRGPRILPLFIAADLLWMSVSARDEERSVLWRMNASRMIDRRTRWAARNGKFYWDIAEPSGAIAFHCMIAMISDWSLYYSQFYMGDVEEINRETMLNKVGLYSLQWLANGILTASTMTDENLLSTMPSWV
jgi:hypothetical protein